MSSARIRQSKTMVFALLIFSLLGCGKVWVEINARSTFTCQTATKYNSCGSGTSSDPYQIYTAAQIQDLANSPSGWAANYKLENTIDMTGVAISQPIGNSTTKFTGAFDGNSQTISNFTLNDSVDSDVGLFGYITTPAVVQNLNLSGVDITGTYIVGGAVGLSDGQVTNCMVSGTVTATGTAQMAGGIVGQNYGTLSQSTANVTVSNSNSYVGGLAGFDGGTISECKSFGGITGSWAGGLTGYENGTVTSSFERGNVSGASAAGGLFAKLEIVAAVQDSYSTGNVVGGASSDTGGIAAYTNLGTIVRCYATGSVSSVSGTIGGVVGYEFSAPTFTGKTFWNNTVNSTLAGIGNGSDSNVVGASTSAMQTQSTYPTGGPGTWDFTSTWMMPSGGVNQGYPVLQWNGNQ